MNAKVEHVREARRRNVATGHHECHWPGCGAVVPPALWGCRPHWYSLPVDIRGRIWRAYRPGQEDTKRPSAAYIEAARAAQEWIAEHEAEKRAGLLL